MRKLIAYLHFLQALQRYENGSVMPSVQMALILAKALETTVEELFQLDDAQE